MRKRLFFFVVLGCFLISLTGCAGVSTKEDQAEQKPLQSQVLLKFTDLPVPLGFKSLLDESYSFESAGMRVGILKYQGKATLDQVVGFYKEQMPMYNWALLNSVEYGDSMMNFEREGESCIVVLSPKGGNITISMSLGPKAQLSAAKKAKRPVK
ncbi:MAG: hypothetical protein NTW13_03440 [Candidatus Omnitrophica bacterium]|nr:hypothetical protein [Candidatus Omnitrophota bacterium]